VVAYGLGGAYGMSQRMQPLDLEDGHMAWQTAGAAEYIERGLTQALDPAHDRKWYVRWQLWSFLLGGRRMLLEAQQQFVGVFFALGRGGEHAMSFGWPPARDAGAMGL
ncbi:hypothetical protein ACEN8K_39045, partial [Variovorax sp. CT11-76]